MKNFQQTYFILQHHYVKENNSVNLKVTLCTAIFFLFMLKFFHPLGAARCVHLLRYQGLAVENYGCTPECLVNERIGRVKNLG